MNETKDSVGLTVPPEHAPSTVGCRRFNLLHTDKGSSPYLGSLLHSFIPVSQTRSFVCVCVGTRGHVCVCVRVRPCVSPSPRPPPPSSLLLLLHTPGSLERVKVKFTCRFIFVQQERVLIIYTNLKVENGPGRGPRLTGKYLFQRCLHSR